MNKHHDFLRAGQLSDAHAALIEGVRSAPGDSSLRISLFDTLCLLGKWEKALGQLEVLRELGQGSEIFVDGFRGLIHCELLRAEVMAGRRTPMFFGEPEPWMGLFVQASQLASAGDFTAAAELRQRALDEAPLTGGTLNGENFAWLMDADSRLGPMIEVVLEGKYLWVPWMRVRGVRIEPPQELRDFVWKKAQFTWTNGGEALGVIPTRYSGTESAESDSLRMARSTDWRDQDGLYFGVGQRMLQSDHADYALLDVRQIEFAETPPL
jgi:type VI secretion system protein ImpE